MFSSKPHASTSQRFTSWAVAIGLLFCTSCLPAVAQNEGYRRGPYLGMTTPEMTTVVWRTGQAIEPVVRIGNSPQQLTRTITRDSIKVRTVGAGDEPLASAPEGVHQYEATITGLTPKTKYYYAVYDGQRLIAGADESYHFVTHPPVDAKDRMRFWVVGDSGTGGTDQARVHEAMRNYVARPAQRPLDFYLHVGDMAYNSGTDAEFHSKYFAPYDVTLRNVVCWPAMGNHEGRSSDGKTGVGPYYDAYVTPTRGEAGGLASGTEAYYSFDYGNVHFIALNSHDLDRNPTAAMAQWLRADLEATRADWIVAFWHHPPYTKGSHDSDREEQLIEVRQHIMPILESAGVDLVLTGHSHIYERSMLMDGAYSTPTVAENVILDDGDGDPNGDGAYRKSAGLNPNEGAVQVVAGHGGTGVRRQGTMPVMKRVFVEHGSVIVDVENDTLTAIMLNADGVQRDLFSIVKQGKVTPRRIANPRQLGPYARLDTLAKIALEQVPEPGATTQSIVEFAELPAHVMKPDANARIEWNANDSWQIEPRTAVVPLSDQRTAQQNFTVSRTGPVFPLPSAKITYNIADQGEGETTTVSANMGLQPFRRGVIMPMQTAPILDGILTVEELAGLVPQSDFVQSIGDGPAQHATEFYAGLYENNLYLAIINHEPDMYKMQLSDTGFDGSVFADDSNEIYIRRDGTMNYFQFVMNASGQRSDRKVTSELSDLGWNGEWRTSVMRGTDRWVSESLISLSPLGEIKPGDVLRFNIVRNNRVQEEASQWSFTNRGGNHRPEYFGTMVVGGR